MPSSKSTQPFGTSASSASLVVHHRWIVCSVFSSINSHSSCCRSSHRDICTCIHSVDIRTLVQPDAHANGEARVWLEATTGWITSKPVAHVTVDCRDSGEKNVNYSHFEVVSPVAQTCYKFMFVKSCLINTSESIELNTTFVCIKWTNLWNCRY